MRALAFQTTSLQPQLPPTGLTTTKWITRERCMAACSDDFATTWTVFVLLRASFFWSHAAIRSLWTPVKSQRSLYSCVQLGIRNAEHHLSLQKHLWDVRFVTPCMYRCCAVQYDHCVQADSSIIDYQWSFSEGRKSRKCKSSAASKPA